MFSLFFLRISEGFTGGLQGIVLDSLSRRPIQNFYLILIESGDTLQGQSGEFHLSNLNDKLVPVCFESPYYSRKCLTLENADGSNSDSSRLWEISLQRIVEEPALLSDEKIPISVEPDSQDPGQNRGDETLSQREIVLRKTEVRGKRLEKKELGKAVLSRSDFKKIPALAEPDVMRSLQLLPGVVASSDFSNKLYVRGGASDQNLVLLDNMVIYSPSHFGGVFSTFNIDALSSALFYKGGFPAYYGDRLSSVLDVKQRAGRYGLFHGGLGVSSLSSKINLEGQWRHFSWLVTGRRTYFDKVLDFFNRYKIIDFKFPYYFYDGQGRFDLTFSSQDSFFFAWYAGKDHLDFFPIVADWGNAAGSLHWERTWKEGLHSSATLFYSQFRQTQKLASAADLLNEIKDSTLQIDWQWEVFPKKKLNCGIYLSRKNVKFQNKVGVLDTTFGDTSGSWMGGYYLDLHTNFFGIWRGVVGSRVSFYDPDRDPVHRWGIEPRFGIETDLTSALKFQAHAGRYLQYLTSVRFGDQEPINEFWYGVKNQMPILESYLFSGGLIFESQNNHRLSYESYYKSFSGMPKVVFPDHPDSIQVASSFSDFFSPLDGFSFGAEWSWEKKTGRVNGSIGYALGFTVIKENDSTIYFSNWDKRHSSHITFNYEWSSNPASKFKFTSHFVNTIGSGLPYGNIVKVVESHPFDRDPQYQEISLKNALRYPYYWRIDLTPLKVSYQIRTIRWNFSLQIINLINRKNVFLYFYDYNNQKQDQSIPRTTISQFPFIPTLGFEMEF